MHVNTVVLGQVAAVTAKNDADARGKLESPEFWIPQAGSHKSWLKALCTALLDSGGVRCEALLLARPLCLVSTWKLSQESFRSRLTNHST